MPVMSFDDACKSVGYDRRAAFSIQKQYVWVAYKNGEAQEFASRQEAGKFSKLIEDKCVNQAEYDAFWAGRRGLEAQAAELWLKGLREYWAELSGALFCVCYNEAYERGHSSGYDEVGAIMHDVVEFALKVRSI